MIPKILTRQEQEDREKSMHRTQIFFSIFMVLILVASTASYAVFFSSSQTERYNGITFTLTEQGYQGRGLEFFTNYLPQEVENIPLVGQLNLNNFLGKKVYVAMNIDGANSAAAEWARAIPMSGFHPACLPGQEEEEGCEELPIKGCEDTDQLNSLLVFKESNQTGMVAQGSCLEINGNQLGLLRAVDKAIFIMYGVVEQ